MPFALVAPSASVEAKTLHMHLVDAPAVFDWNGAVANPEAPVVHLIGESLYRFRPGTGKPVPALAESVQKSKDLRKYTFTLRKDARWSDGRPVVAQDFVDSWIRLLSPQSASLYAYYLFDIEGAREFHTKPGGNPSMVGISAEGERTLVVRLREPVPDWEQVPTFWPTFPVRKDLIEKLGERAFRPGVLHSSGPFVLESFEPGKKLVLLKNRFYSRAKTNLDRIEIDFDQDLERAYSRYRSGFYPFLQFFPCDKVAGHAKKGDLLQPPLHRSHLLIANAKKYPMTIRDFRAAIMMAVNPVELNRGCEGRFSRASGMIPPPLPGATEEVVAKPDPTEAARRLERSGVVVSTKLRLRILTRSGESFESFGRKIEEQLRKTLGVEVELLALSPGEFGGFAGLSDYDLILSYWNAKIPSARDFLFPHSGQAKNSRLRFDSAIYDELVDRLRITGGGKAEAATIRKAQEEYVRNEFVILPLANEKATVLRSRKIRNLSFHFMGFPLLDDVILED